VKHLQELPVPASKVEIAAVIAALEATRRSTQRV